jgi:arylsulfatase A-like enzyme
VFQAVAVASPVFAASPAAKPNLIVILIDDLGYSDVGAYGSKDVPTPHIDSLARNGVRYTNGYVTCIYCSPSRAALLTGRYQQRYGLEYVDGRLDPKEKTIADLLKEQGYATAAVGKWHIGSEPYLQPRKRGFDYYFGYLGGCHYYNLPVPPELVAHPTDYWLSHLQFGSLDAGPMLSKLCAAPIYRNEQKIEPTGYLTEILTHEAVQFIERSKDRPFFLYLAHAAQHAPVQATEKYLSRFPNLTDENLRKTYAASLSAVDDGVGEILAKLKDLNLEKNTAVVFLSDNGGPSFWKPRPEILETIRSGGAFGSPDVFGLDDNITSPDWVKLSEKFRTVVGANGSDNEPLAFGKGVMYEGGIRVPFLVQWPGVAPSGKVSDEIVSSLDILPTFLAAAGVKLPGDREYDGIDLHPAWEGKAAGLDSRTLFWRVASDRAVRSGSWKLVWSGKAVPHLYDLSKDTEELNDLAASHPDVVLRLQDAWTQWNQKNAPPPARADLARAIKILRSGDPAKISDLIKGSGRNKDLEETSKNSK